MDLLDLIEARIEKLERLAGNSNRCVDEQTNVQ